MKTLDIKYYNDPGHGWLEVHVNLLKRLKIVELISSCSYLSDGGILAYLEEDCDASILMKAAKEQGFKVNVNPVYENGYSFIRNLPTFKPENMAVSTMKY